MKALVVGFGRMGRFHARALRDLDVEVTTLDPDPHAGAEYTALPVRYKRFDIVCVACPIEHLAEQAAFWASQCDALLIEKPMAATVQEARMLSHELRNKPVAVGYVERFNPRLQDLKRALEGEKPLIGTFKRWNIRPTANVLLDLKSHDVDLAHYLGVGMANFDTCAGMPKIVRRISVATTSGMHSADLLAHNRSPLHDQWTDFLSGGGECATVTSSVRVLEQLLWSERRIAA